MPVFRMFALTVTLWTCSPQLLAQSNNGQEPTSTAVAGQPFGILAFNLSLPEDWDGRPPRILIQEADGRVYFPAVTPILSEILIPSEPLFPQRIGRPGGLIDRVRSAVRSSGSKREVPVGVRVHALFHGDQPLSLQVFGDMTQKIQIPVVAKPSETVFTSLFNDWWAATQVQAAGLVASQNSQSSLPHYLISMLARRFDLPPVELPEPPRNDTGLFSLSDSKPQFLETIETLLGSDRLKDQSVRRILRQPLVTDEQLLPLPPEPYWQPIEVPQAELDVTLEEIASRVPPECFYLRFGSFSNYVWFTELGQRFGGDLSNAVLLSGLNNGGMARAEKMLATRMTTVSKMFGNQLIKDMALFGNDLYFGDGPSLGVLFQSTNTALLKASFDADRKALMSENPDATIVELVIADKKVSLISTPDNRIRAFLVVDGPFVVISTSQRLVERFLDVGQGQPSLASTDMFGWVRYQMPVENEYSVFGYFSPEFFQKLLGPHYQIELRRRLVAAAHLELAEIASCSATIDESWLTPSTSQSTAANWDPSIDLNALKESKLLPAWFDQRPDGARVLRNADHWVDSTRGGRGSFLPITDVEVISVSSEEAEEYASTAEYYQKQWGRMDPLFFGLRRFQIDDPNAKQPVPLESPEIVSDSTPGSILESEAPSLLDGSPPSHTLPSHTIPSRNGGHVEQFTIEAFLAPFEPKKYGWVFEQLAAPSQVTVQFPPDDMLSVQMRFQGMLPDESYYLFGGLKDMLPPATDEAQGLIKSLRVLKAAPAYLGAWPKPDLIQKLPLGIGSRLAQPDFAGYSRAIGGLWRWQDDQWSLLSFHKNILDTAQGHMEIGQASDSAQIRVSLADLYESQLAQWIDQYWWEMGWKSSHTNAAFLDMLNQQFKVPAQNCPQVASRILNAQLQCALGGQYELQTLAQQPSTAVQPTSDTRTTHLGHWNSTAWKSGGIDIGGKPIAPAEYSAPWVQYLRGAQIHVTQQPQSLFLAGLVQVDLPPLPDSSSSGNSDDRRQATQLPKRDFNVFELPLKLFGKKNDKNAENKNKDERVEALPKKQRF